MVIELGTVLKYQMSLYAGVFKQGRTSTSYGKTFTNSGWTLPSPYVILS